MLSTDGTIKMRQKLFQKILNGCWNQALFLQ